MTRFTKPPSFIDTVENKGKKHSHYFINDEKLAHTYNTITYFNKRLFKFITDAGVFSKDRVDEASEILVDSVIDVSGPLLDMGCGYGFLGIVLGAIHDIPVTLCDINERALALCRENCRQNGIGAEVVLSDGATAIEGTFGTVVTNPPIRAGKQVVFRFYEEAHAKLRPGGALYVVIRKKHGAESTRAKLLELFSRCETVYHKKGLFVYKAVKT